MAKKTKDEVPNPNSVSNRDVLQRLNFLYQASAYLDSISTSPRPLPPVAKPDPQVTGSDTTLPPICTCVLCMGIIPPEDRMPPKESKKLRRKRERKATIGRELSTSDIAMSYVRCMKQVGQKTTVKMDPSVKRTLCVACDTVLVPGVSSSVRLNASRNGRTIVTTCLRCKRHRKIPAPPTQDPETPSTSSIQEPGEMAIDQTPSTSQAKLASPRRINGRHNPRPLPFFERDVGHVIFRGNERLDVS
ncbi:Rpr2-domain-containing protein [Dentipellis sp. KUC8613]|nr:Rpr2-domain-containing protein [Dentipellis sp. KUC8613]